MITFSSAVQGNVPRIWADGKARLAVGLVTDCQGYALAQNLAQASRGAIQIHVVSSPAVCRSRPVVGRVVAKVLRGRNVPPCELSSGV